MTSYVPPIKNGASGWIGYVSLAPRTPSGIWQANPTLATGDVKLSIDGAALANLGTLPAVTPASSKLVKITLSQAETNGDNLTIIFNDAAGAEWCDLTINLQTVARQIDDLAYPATSGRSMVVDAAGLVDANAVKVGPSGSGTAQTARDVGASVLLSSGTGTGQVKLASGYVAPNWGDVGNPTTTLNLSATTVKTATDVETDTQDIQSRLPAALGANGNIKADVRDYSGTAGTFSGGRPEVNTSHAAGTAWNSGAIGPNTLASDTITGAKVAADVGTEIGTAVWATTTRILTAATNLPSASDIATAVWGAATRLLTAGTNIVLAKGTGVTGFNDLSAAEVNAEADTAISDAALATAANLATLQSTANTIDAKTTNLPSDPADQSLIIAATNALATLIGDVPTNAELAAALGGADDAVINAIAALNNLSAADVAIALANYATTQITESYAANGVAPTRDQVMMAIHQAIMQFNIDGVHKVVKRLDNVTPAFTITHNSATAPTGAART